MAPLPGWRSTTVPLKSPISLHMVGQPGDGFVSVSLAIRSLNPVAVSNPVQSVCKATFLYCLYLCILQKNKDNTTTVPLTSPTSLHMVEQPGGGFASVSLTTVSGSGTPVGGGISLLSMPLQSPSSESLSLQESQELMSQSPKLTLGSPRATPSQSPRHPSPSGSPRGPIGKA